MAFVTPILHLLRGCALVAVCAALPSSALAMDQDKITLHRAHAAQPPPIVAAPVSVPELLRAYYTAPPPKQTAHRATLTLGLRPGVEPYRCVKDLAQLPIYRGDHRSVPAIYVSQGTVESERGSGA